MTGLELKSSSFSDVDEIPKKYGYKHGNENPPLSINGIPSENEELFNSKLVMGYWFFIGKLNFSRNLK